MSYLNVNAKELMAEKCRAQAAERRYFGYSVLAEVDRDMRLKKSTPETDVFLTNGGQDDGKISFGEKVVNFGKGLIKPIKNMFSSPKNIAITALSALGAAALIVLTGGAAAPVMVGAGIIGGGVQIVKGMKKQAEAVTDAQAAAAWQDMGSGTFAVGASIAGAKASLKVAGANTQGLSAWKAAGKCITDLPKYAKTAYKNGSANIAKIIASIKKTPVTVVDEQSPVLTTSKKSRKTLKSSKGENAPRLPKSSRDGQKMLEAPKSSTTADVIELPGPKTEPPSVIELPESSVASNANVPQNAKPISSNATVIPDEVITPDGRVIKLDTKPKSYSQRLADKLNDVISSAKESPSKKSLGEKIKNTLNIFGLFKPKKK